MTSPFDLSTRAVLVIIRRGREVAEVPVATLGAGEWSACGYQAGAAALRQKSEPILVTIPRSLPLFTLLSFSLVAFTIESDNAFEERMAHRHVGLRRAPRRFLQSARASVAHFAGDVFELPEAHWRRGCARGRTRAARADARESARDGALGLRDDRARSGGHARKIPARDWIIRATQAGKKSRESVGRGAAGNRAAMGAPVRRGRNSRVARGAV